ncbi:MAG: FadR/GntR family transcriptional regulator [Thermodesulfobacteriota bacterium]|nr:FadR/GntR family transcriptional regulator [Thermodesulfobacteriota bacterium]
MEKMLKPIQAESLKDVFVSRFEELILSGRLYAGQRLPSERELSLQMGVSRPVVHEGLRELSARDLITMKPRAGACVSDYRMQGSISVLSSLINYRNGSLDPGLMESMLAMRSLLELENAGLAARNRTDQDQGVFEGLLERERAADPGDTGLVVELDFAFHHMVALATQNLVYPLLLNSLKPVYTNLTTQFFSDPEVTGNVFTLHGKLYQAIKAQAESMSVSLMQDLLDHGKEHLYKIFCKGDNS